MTKKRSNKKIFSFIIFAILLIVGIRSYLRKDKQPQKKQETEQTTPSQKEDKEVLSESDFSGDIAQLTREQVVVSFVRKNHRLPDYYITKKAARRRGWQPGKGNLCKVLPGKAIGGDLFGNRERKLPQKATRRYYEADINYDCGYRGKDRLVYSSDGLIFVTKDHYRTFQKK